MTAASAVRGFGGRRLYRRRKLATSVTALRDMQPSWQLTKGQYQAQDRSNDGSERRNHQKTRAT